MRPHLMLIAATVAATASCAATASAATASPVAAMRDHRRILLVAATDPHDARAVLQRRILAEWKVQAADRDLSLVEIAGDRVVGASDGAAALRKAYGLAPGRFQALLIGKDGHVALRSAKPIDAGTLQGSIDAMPMRRAGGR